MELTKFIKHRHTRWEIFSGRPEFQSILADLSTEDRLPHRKMTQISESTGIPVSTLKTWRRKRKKNPKYQPKHGRPESLKLPNHVIANLLEHSIVRVNNNEYFPMPMFRSFAKTKAEEAGITDFQASNRWVMKTLRDNDLSFRTPHIQRRTPPIIIIIMLALSSTLRAPLRLR